MRDILLLINPAIMCMGPQGQGRGELHSEASYRKSYDAFDGVRGLERPGEMHHELNKGVVM